MAFNAPKINSIDVSGIASGLRDSMRQLREDNQRAWQQQLEGMKMAGESANTWRDYNNNELNNEAVKEYLKLLQQDDDDRKSLEEFKRILKGWNGNIASSNSYASYGLNNPQVQKAVMAQLIGKKAGF